MSGNNPNWLNLSKDATDPTTIGEEIAAQIVDHNDDADAHLGDGQALESHRAAEIIDHLAESVVNDKLKTSARAYVAIVDPDSPSDFDTLQSAIDYADGVGGGTILIMPGTHYLAGQVDIPSNINLFGADAESVIIATDNGGGDFLNIIEDTATGQLDMYFQGISFTSTGDAGVKAVIGDAPEFANIRFINCSFKGGNSYVQGNQEYWFFDGCKFECNATTALFVEPYVTITNCNIIKAGSPSTLRFLANDPDYGDPLSLSILGSTFNGAGVTSNKYIDTDQLDDVISQNSNFYNWDISPTACRFGRLYFNTITLKSAQVLSVGSSYGGMRWIGNAIGSGATPNVACAGFSCIILGNTTSGQIFDTGTENLIKFNTPEIMYKVLATSATAMALGLNYTAELTPTSTRTLTSTVPHAGERRSVVILTSGTTSYTLTFGTGFKTTGTLATGVTSARRFVIDFVSDGTYLIETSRTVAIA